MTTRRKPDTEQAATPELEQPAQGGSYVRRGDGTLERVEFTDERPAEIVEVADPATDADDNRAEG